MPRESVDPARPIRPGNATLAEVHRDRFQSRASDGDGGRGVAVMTESELAARSNLHSGAWQRRAGARLAGKFLPRRQFIGYGRGRGEIVPEEPPPSLDDDDPLALPGPRIYVEDEDGNYLEQDPNLMEPSARAAWNAKQRKKVSDEAAALAATRGLNGTVRVHSDSKTTPAENENHLLLRRRKLADGAKPLRPLLTPCWAEIEPERGSIPSGNSKSSDKKLSDKMSDNEPGVRISAPWATLGDVRAEPTNAGTSTRPGAGSGDAANASVSYVDPRDRVDRPAAIERKAKYTGRHSHHKDYREVRGVCEISRVVREEPTMAARRREQPPPPSPATLLHRSYLELDGGLEAYAPEMREGDEPPPSPPRPPRNAKSRARYHEHRGGGRWTVAEMAVPAGIDVGDVAAGAGRDGTAKSLRPTAPKKILRGRERADAMKRDYPYGPCTF